MKVCTDACLFGAIAASMAAANWNNRILDIGTGTGLLSLMAAQKNTNALINAVEIDEAAAQQASENFAASPWGERFKIYHTSIQQFVSSTDQQYDLVISNPPFFDNDLKSPDEKRNMALHSSALSLEDLLSAINKLLSNEGVLGILLPYHRTAFFEKLAIETGLYLSRKILVKQTHRHDYFRSILFFNRREVPAREQEIIIKDAGNEYTTEFADLLRDYYLYL